MEDNERPEWPAVVLGRHLSMGEPFSEAFERTVANSGLSIADAIEKLADAVNNVADAIRTHGDGVTYESHNN